jgi:hypothetical protein
MYRYPVNHTVSFPAQKIFAATPFMSSICSSEFKDPSDEFSRASFKKQTFAIPCSCKMTFELKKEVLIKIVCLHVSP